MCAKHNSAIVGKLNSLNFRVGYMGYTTVDDRWKSNSLATPFNRLYIIYKGKGMLSSGVQEVTLEPGKAYLLPAGLPCSYSCEGSLSLFYLHFDLGQEGQTDLLGNITCLPVAEYSCEKAEYLCSCIDGSGYGDAFEAVHEIQSILLDMSKTYPFRWDEISNYSPCVVKAIRQIRRELSAQLRIDDLARSQFLSRSYLTRQFREQVGMPIKQYIHMQLVNTAQWQLSNTDASIERISSDLGFCNQFYFSEFFKKRCKVSPLQYRNGTKYY